MIPSQLYEVNDDNNDDGSINSYDIIPNGTGAVHHVTSILKGNHIHHNRF